MPDDGVIVLGRDDGDWFVPWDRFISHRQAQIQWDQDRLLVEKLPAARNPLVYKGQEIDRFTLKPGEQFVAGKTIFRLEADQPDAPPGDRSPVQKRAVSIQELQSIPFRNAPHQIDVLSRLPNVISGAANDMELFERLGNLLLAGIRRADAVAVVASGGTLQDSSAVEVLHSEGRLTGQGEFQPSQRLVREALRRQETVVHVWQTGSGAQDLAFTAQSNFDWALCTPVRCEICKGWGIYVAGRFPGDAAATLLAPWDVNQLGDDLKFTELVASFLSSLRQLQFLQRRQAALSPFFSPAVLRTLTDADPEAVLQPRETDVTVLFCDLRGFARQSEKQTDNLMGLLERVSKALGVMTQNILDEGGVIADFQGDAALGFWGWPLAQPDKVRRACRAALGIRSLFEAAARQADNPLAGFQVGIGLASGRAVAGKIGSEDQVKVGVFGPVVNIASRLQDMTKVLRAPILMDEATAKLARERLSRDVGRCRRLLNVKPYGMSQPLTVCELLPPATIFPIVSDEQLGFFEKAVDAFIQGNWARAYELFHLVSPQDRGKDFVTSYIIQHDHTPPASWDGVVSLASK